MAQISLKDAKEFIKGLNSFAILDEDARYIYVSENWCRMIHCTEEQALGAPRGGDGSGHIGTSGI